MRINLKHGIWVLAVAVGASIGGGTVRAQDHDRESSSNRPYQETVREDHQDFTKDKTYQQGMREGRNDHAHNRDHSKKRHFKRDQDQKAYEAGYQQGHDRK
jgi:hypothetical protein